MVSHYNLGYLRTQDLIQAALEMQQPFCLCFLTTRIMDVYQLLG